MKSMQVCHAGQLTHQHSECAAVVNGAGQHHGGVAQVALQVAVRGVVGEQHLWEERKDMPVISSSSSKPYCSFKKKLLE